MFILHPFFLLISTLVLTPTSAIRSFSNELTDNVFHTKGLNFLDDLAEYKEAPDYQNGLQCPIFAKKDGTSLVCDPSLVHISMTLDSEYVRGSIAAIHSILKHTSCPQNLFFHFIASNKIPKKVAHLTKTVNSTFPSLSFKVYQFNETPVKKLISSSIRRALEEPLNYARIYLAELLEPCVDRVIYLDSDIIVVDDIQKLWSVQLTGSRVIGAPEYCQANFTNYFTHKFWSDAEMSNVFEGKRACYFNTGVMVMDLGRWRGGDYSRRIEKWMEIQKEKRIYDLGSLPPFLLVFGGDVEGIDHRWNQHGLGGNNVVNSCRSLHPGKVSLLHWSGKGKPWVRLDAGRACLVDSLWAPYDLYHQHLRSSDSL